MPTLEIPVESIRIVVTEEPDHDPDVSWLEQTDEQMGEGWGATAQPRLAAFNAGDWAMVGLVATAVADINPDRPFSRPVELSCHSLWNIESDMTDDYRQDVISDLASEVRTELAQRFGITPEEAQAIPVETA